MTRQSMEDLRQEVRRFLEDDVEDDGWLDEATAALVWAIAELRDEDVTVVRAWSADLHPRGPDGRFLSTVERLKKALTTHLNGSGKGDPFDGFSREQLRKAAKARGIPLKRGESRDSIASKLLDHLGGKSEVKESAPKKAPPRPRTPKRLTPAQELVRWRAEAAKPGRIKLPDTGPTKRETYVATWDRAIAQTRKEIAAAEASGNQHRLPDLKKTLDWQVASRAAVRDKPDPSLDEPASGPTFKLAQKVDQARPLAVYGDVLHMDSTDDAWTHANMTELEKVPADLHGAVAAHMASTSTGGIWVGDTAVSDMDHSHDLAGETPRGWGDGQTFDDVNGVYRPSQRVMLVGRTANSEVRGARTATHEFGHALDAALGTPSFYGGWKAIHEKALAAPHLSPYYKQPGQAGREEFWAEAFSTWVTARQGQSGYDTRAEYIIRLNVSAELGDQIHDYFNQLIPAEMVK